MYHGYDVRGRGGQQGVGGRLSGSAPAALFEALDGSRGSAAEGEAAGGRRQPLVPSQPRPEPCRGQG